MEIVTAYDRQKDAAALVAEYTELLAKRGEDVQKCLAAQQLEKELHNLWKKYGPPRGAMYLALVNGRAVGCAALTPNDGETCEIKRLYVRPAYRGLHIGRALTEKIIDTARFIGYRRMRLDTFPFMDKAIRMYESLGFVRIGRYNDNPVETAVFMQLEL